MKNTCFVSFFIFIYHYSGVVAYNSSSYSLQWGKWERKQEYDLICMDEMEKTGEDIHIALMYWFMFKHK